MACCCSYLARPAGALNTYLCFCTPDSPVAPRSTLAAASVASTLRPAAIALVMTAPLSRELRVDLRPARKEPADVAESVRCTTRSPETPDDRVGTGVAATIVAPRRSSRHGSGPAAALSA